MPNLLVFIVFHIFAYTYIIHESQFSKKGTCLVIIKLLQIKIFDDQENSYHMNAPGIIPFATALTSLSCRISNQASLDIQTQHLTEKIACDRSQ